MVIFAHLCSGHRICKWWHTGRLRSDISSRDALISTRGCSKLPHPNKPGCPRLRKYDQISTKMPESLWINIHFLSYFIFLKIGPRSQLRQLMGWSDKLMWREMPGVRLSHIYNTLTHTMHSPFIESSALPCTVTILVATVRKPWWHGSGGRLSVRIVSGWVEGGWVYSLYKSTCIIWVKG